MRRVQARSDGFTIVELLIVIVVIAILATISIAVYNGVQARAKASSVSSALTQAKKKIAVWQVDNPNTSPTDLATAGVTATSDVSYQYTAGSNGAYCITATNGTVSYKISESTNPTAGGCAGHGQGGVAAITNLVTNPSFEGTILGWASSSAGASNSTTGAASGTYSIVVTPSGASTDSFVRYGSTSSLPTGVSVGSTYTVSGTIYVPTAQTGSIDTRARGITVYSWNGATATGLGQSTLAANATGSTRISVTFTVPAGATGLEIRFYNGATNSASNLVYWDATMLTSGSTLYNYADGASTNWAWNGTANNSTSTGPPQ